MAETNSDSTVRSAVEAAFHAGKYQDFRTWIDRFYDRLPMGLVVPSILGGLFVYMLGFGIAYVASFQGTYVKTAPVYMGAFGIAWVTGAIRWASVQIRRALPDIRPCFLLSDDDFDAFLRKWLGRFTSNTGIVSVIAILVILAWIAVYISAFRPDILGHYRLISLRPTLFPDAWFEANVGWNVGILMLYGLACAAPLGTGLWILSVNIGFLSQLRTLRVLPIPGVILVKFRGMTNFYLFVAYTWFVGVGLFAGLFFGTFDAVAISVIATLGSFGFLTFLWPEYVFHGYLLRAHQEIADALIALYKQHIGNAPLADVTTSIQPGAWNDKLQIFESIAETSKPVDLWVHDLTDWAILIWGQSLPILAVFLRSALGSP